MSMTRMMSRTRTNLVIPVIMAQAALGLVVPSDVRAADVVKSATGTELTDGASWGGTAPGSGDAATWISTSLGAGLTLGSPSSWDGIGVSSALSDITISGASALTLGSGGIDMSASTVNMTLNMPVELAAHQRWTVNAGKSLTLTNTISGASMSLAKAGSGTLNLLGTHTYSGTNTISAGSVYLGNSGTAASISSASPLHFTGSGLFAHYGRSGLVNSQVINGLFVSGGAAGIYTRNWGTSTTTDLRGPGGTLPVTRSIGTTVDFNKTDAAAYIRLVNGNDASGIIGAWATFGGAADWAVNDGSDYAAAYTGYNTLSGNSLASGASVNYRVTTNTPTGNITLDTTGTIDVNTLRISDTAARTIDVRNGTTPGILRFGAIGGILTSGGRHAIGLPGPSTNGTITAGGTDNTAGELIMNNSGSSDTDIRSDIADNGSGAVSLIKSGGGWLHLSGSNTYSGGTFVNGGGLRAWNANALGAPGSINVTVRSAQFNAGGTHNFLGNLTLDNSTFVCGVNGIPWGGPITLSSDSTINSDLYGATLPGNISGAGGFTKTGNQNLNLSGTNTYSGRTVVSTGTYLEFQKLVSAYNGDESKWTPANITVYTNTGLRVFVGGAGQFSIDQAGLLFTRLMSVDNNGLRAGSHIGITSTGGSYTLTNNLTDSIGPGGGKVGLYIGSLSNLELAGSNTFSGKVTMWAGTTLKVSSFNYVSSGSLSPNTSSSLGKPTTVEDGTIDIGGDWTDGGTLIYTGSGETTDRVLKLRAGHELYQFLLHQSGGGLLKFTSPFVYNQARGNVGIDIRPYGSTAGIGELAMSIPDNGTQVTEIRKYGTGVWILSGTNSYTGPTVINEGTLLVNGLNSTGAVTVIRGGTLGGTGVVAGVVTLNTGDANGAGGAINVRDGAVSTFTLASNLFCNGNATYPNSLYLDLGDSAGVSDKIVLSGTNSAPTTNSVLVHFRNQITGGPPAGTCTLIQGGSAGNNYTGYALAVTNAGRKTYSGLGASGNDLVVTVADGNAGPANAYTYWSGNVTNVWSAATWYADEDFSSASAGPGYRSNVRLVPASARLSNTLGQDYEINSLTVDPGVGAVTIANNTLTLDATADNGNTAGNGITIGNTAGVTIASKVGVAGSQTWTIGSGATGTVTGVIDNFDNGSTITKAGDGTLYLKGLNVFKGEFTVAEGVVKVDSINNNLTRGALGMSTNPVVLGKAGGGTGTLEYTGGTASSSMYFRMADGGGGVFQIDSASATQTLSGVISGGGSLAKTGPGTLLLSGFNTYTGITEVVAGKMIISKPYLSTNAVVYLADTNSLILDFAGSNQIGALYVNGVRQIGGPVGGTVGTNYYFGTGSIYLPPDLPPAGTVLIIR